MRDDWRRTPEERERDIEFIEALRETLRLSPLPNLRTGRGRVELTDEVRFHDAYRGTQIAMRRAG
jgi:hypothetical protein